MRSLMIVLLEYNVPHYISVSVLADFSLVIVLLEYKVPHFDKRTSFIQQTSSHNYSISPAVHMIKKIVEMLHWMCTDILLLLLLSTKQTGQSIFIIIYKSIYK